MEVEITVAIVGSIGGIGDHTSLRNIHGDRGFPLGSSPSCQALSYLPEPWGVPLQVSTLTFFITGHQLWGAFG